MVTRPTSPAITSGLWRSITTPQARIAELGNNVTRYNRTLSRTKPNWHEYTTGHLYDRSDGAALEARDLLFLEAKIALCTAPPADSRPVVLKVAAIVVRHTDIEWQDTSGKHHEKNDLDDKELGTYRMAWRIAMDAVGHYSGGRVRVETDWHDLTDVTVTGLTSDTYKGLFPTRHLDPTMLVPAQDEMFKKLVKDHDWIVFVWDRGRAAMSFGGGPIQLPFKSGRLPLRGAIRSMPPSAGTCVHEFLHSVERRVSVPRVHGPRGDWMVEFDASSVEDGTDWLLHVLRSVENWRKVRYR